MTGETLQKPKKRARPGNLNRKPSAWQRSLTFASIGTEALRRFRSERDSHKKCGARSKSTGQPCRQLALENGRCHWHGGATPSGAEWGKRQVNAKPASHQKPSDWRKVEAKLKKRAAEDQDRIRRLRAMPDAEFWQYVRRLGRRADDRFAPAFSKALREEKARRGLDPTARIQIAAPREAPDPELAALDAEIERLKAELEKLPTTGVFA